MYTVGLLSAGTLATELIELPIGRLKSSQLSETKMAFLHCRDLKAFAIFETGPVRWDYLSHQN